MPWPASHLAIYWTSFVPLYSLSHHIHPVLYRFRLSFYSLHLFRIFLSYSNISYRVVSHLETHLWLFIKLIAEWPRWPIYIYCRNTTYWLVTLYLMRLRQNSIFRTLMGVTTQSIEWKYISVLKWNNGRVKIETENRFIENYETSTKKIRWEELLRKSVYVNVEVVISVIIATKLYIHFSTSSQVTAFEKRHI